MSIIKNKEALATNSLRKDALDILEAGLEAIDTEKILRKKITFKEGKLCIDEDRYICENYERIFFVGIGKCALGGAKVIEDILGDKLTEGIVLDIKAGDLKKIKSLVGTHPHPSEQNISATKEILKMVANLTEKDLVVTLISGGGSSLFELPIEGVSLQDIIDQTKELTAKGADIYELNKARKEMSQVKGGKFAKLCQPASMVSLIFSDVLGNDLSVIASGPTVSDEPNEKVKNILISSNKDALTAMKERAEKLGFNTKVETETLSGNASEVGKMLAEKELQSKTCLLFGGETTVKISEDHGEGGRNQEMALSALPHMKSGAVLVCVASDGWDNTDHAGAIADTPLFEKSKELNLLSEEYLKRSDSYNFFKKVFGGICTSRLGSNVSDLCILLYK